MLLKADTTLCVLLVTLYFTFSIHGQLWIERECTLPYKVVTKARFTIPELTGDRFPLPVNTGRVDGCAFETHTRQHGPCWQVMETGHPSTQVVETGLKWWRCKCFDCNHHVYCVWPTDDRRCSSWEAWSVHMTTQHQGGLLSQNDQLFQLSILQVQQGIMHLGYWNRNRMYTAV